MKKYLPKDILENIKKVDKVCREMKRNKKNSFKKVVIKRLPYQMTLQSKATTRRQPLECCQNLAAILKLKSPTRKRCSNLLESPPKTAPMFISFNHPAVSVPVPHLGEDWIHADGMIDVFGGVLHETIVILLHSFLRGTFAILSWGRLGVFNVWGGLHRLPKCIT